MLFIMSQVFPLEDGSTDVSWGNSTKCALHISSTMFKQAGKNFFWSPVSRIVPKNVKGALWEFLNIHSFAK